MATKEAQRTKHKPAPDKDTKRQTGFAPLYRVLIHNDDITTMDFVVHILRTQFQKTEEEAIQIMLRAHHTGISHVATLPLEQAEFRVDQSHSLARARKFPLKLTYEPET
jgi:ATP-dependent Clp protease adaptor protein ClpS